MLNTPINICKLEPNEIDFSQCFSQKAASGSCSVFNSLLARDNFYHPLITFANNFYHPLITFANSLDPDQARHFVGPDLDPNCLTP